MFDLISIDIGEQYTNHNDEIEIYFMSSVNIILLDD